MRAHESRNNYVAIWIWLLVLMGVGLAASLLTKAHALAVTVIFAAAVAKAFLVALNYMHLKTEPWIIYAVAAFPVLLALVLGMTLVPDFTLYHH